MAARRNKRMVTQAEFEDAKDKVMMGAERKSLVMTEEEKMLTAYHEGGHAIVALNVKATDPVHKATIIPRGRALGMVMQLPERDKLSMSFEQMTSRLAIMMGGRVAEEMIFGKDKVTSGAQSDIEQATRLARMMVTRWGFSPELGAVSYGENQDEVFLGMSVARPQNVSEATAQKIDIEIRRLVEAAHDEARQVLEAKRADLEVLAKGLLEFETLSGDEIKDLLAGKRPTRESVIEPQTPRSSAVPPAGKSRPRPVPRPARWSRSRRLRSSTLSLAHHVMPGLVPGIHVLWSAAREVRSSGRWPGDDVLGCACRLQNRVDPFGELFATSARGTLFGNRGGRFHVMIKRSSAGAGCRGRGFAACWSSRTASATFGAAPTPSCSFSTRRPRLPPATVPASNAGAGTPKALPNIGGGHSSSTSVHVPERWTTFCTAND